MSGQRETQATDSRMFFKQYNIPLVLSTMNNQMVSFAHELQN